MSNKENEGLEFLANADALNDKFNKAEGFIEKNNKLFMYIGAAVLAAVAGYYAFNYWSASKEKEAQAAMYNSVFSFEADSLNQALKGKGGNEGLLAVADEYGSTKAGNLANYYAGIALLNQGKFKEAIERLDKFSANDQVVQAKAYCLIGDCNMELKNTSEAVKYYEKAAKYEPNKFSTPGYLMKLATAYSSSKNNNGALEVYTEIVNKYASSNEAGMAKKYKAKLEAETGK